MAIQVEYTKIFSVMAIALVVSGCGGNNDSETGKSSLVSVSAEFLAEGNLYKNGLISSP